MKNILIPALIITGVTIASYKFEEKIQSVSGLIDDIRGGMRNVIGDVSPDANFSFRFLGDSTKAYVAFAYTRYLLVPMYVSTDIRKYDTTLTVCDARLYERIKGSVDTGKQVLSAGSYNKYVFLKTISHEPF